MLTACLEGRLDFAKLFISAAAQAIDRDEVNMYNTMHALAANIAHVILLRDESSRCVPLF